MRISKLFLFTFLTVSIFSCGNLKTVDFQNPVDTTSKQITLQPKRTYTLEKLGVYASNEFDGARLNGFQRANDSTAAVVIKPENKPINMSPYYAFKIWSEKPKALYLTFQYPNGYKHRYIPKLKKNNTWKIIDSTQIFKTDSIVTIKVALNKQPLTVAAQELHTSSDVRKWYTGLIEDKNYVHEKIYGKSVLGKPLPVLDIYKGEKKEKPLVILLTRQHPPEVTGYYAFQEFLSTILNDSKIATQFLNRYRVLAFPIINPDGVDLGHWRHNAGGVDLNRDWSKYNQPEIRNTVAFINKELKKENSEIILGLDFHSTWHDVFYTNDERKGTSLPHFISKWFASLEANIPNYEVNESSGNSRSPVSKGWFLYGHDATGITYEIGDRTPKERIKVIGKISAVEMMKILNQIK